LISEDREFQLPVVCRLDKDPHTIQATIHGVRNGIFQLSFPMALRTGQQLAIRRPERTIESQVVYSKRQENGAYLVGLLMACDADRRSETRTPVDLPALLRVADSRTIIPTRVVDLSTRGLGLELPLAIPVGSTVFVDLKAGTAVGEVRHCNKILEKFRAGVRMREFVLPPNGRRVWLSAAKETGSAAVLQSLMRSVQERQSRYEAILYSLALP
jgi:hypothetical protein